MEIKETIENKNNEVILYTTGCILCKALKKMLDNAKIDYIQNTDEEIMISKGFDRLPILEVDGKTYEYKDAIKWIKIQEVV